MPTKKQIAESVDSLYLEIDKIKQRLAKFDRADLYRHGVEAGDIGKDAEALIRGKWRHCRIDSLSQDGWVGIILDKPPFLCCQYQRTDKKNVRFKVTGSFWISRDCLSDALVSWKYTKSNQDKKSQ